MPPASGSPPFTNRRELYREYLSRFNPAEIAQDAFEHGNLLDAISQEQVTRIATKAELNPGSQQILVGGIGTGKSTILWRASKELESRQQPSFYLDCSLQFDLSFIAPGSMIAAVLLGLTDRLSDKREKFHSLISRVHKIAFGGAESVTERYLPNLLGARIEIPDISSKGIYRTREIVREYAPKLQPLSKLDNKDVVAMIELFDQFRKDKTAAPFFNSVLLLDGFDRVLHHSDFKLVLMSDLRAFKQLGLTVILSGPLAAAHGDFAAVHNLFDAFHHIYPVESNERGTSVLVDVLRKRRAFGLLDEKLAYKVIDHSGGILRDLIGLVKDSAENAYSDGRDEIQEEHIGQAIDQLGSTYLKAAGSQVSRLKRNPYLVDLDPNKDEDLGLLQKRIVLERPQRFEVHPALMYSIKKANL